MEGADEREPKVLFELVAVERARVGIGFGALAGVGEGIDVGEGLAAGERFEDFAAARVVVRDAPAEGVVAFRAGVRPGAAGQEMARAASGAAGISSMAAWPMPASDQVPNFRDALEVAARRKKLRGP
jgi:hypothetical protein